MAKTYADWGWYVFIMELEVSAAVSFRCALFFEMKTCENGSFPWWFQRHPDFENWFWNTVLQNMLGLSGILLLRVTWPTQQQRSLMTTQNQAWDICLLLWPCWPRLPFSLSRTCGCSVFLGERGSIQTSNPTTVDALTADLWTKMKRHKVRNTVDKFLGLLFCLKRH